MSFELGTICLQVIIVLLSLMAALRGSRLMFGFVIAFGIYLYLSLAAYNSWHFKIMGWGSDPLLIFIATASVTFSVWEVYRN